MNLFFVTSRGLTATTWYSNALNINKQVFCSHGRDRPNRGIETDSLLSDESYRHDRLNYEQWQRKANIQDFVEDLIKASNGENLIGNVHGYVLIEIMDKLKSSELKNVIVANMIRHPLGFIESYTSLVNHRKNDYPEKFFAEHGKRAEENKDLIFQYNVDLKDLEMIGFIEACQSLIKSANEMRMHQVYTIKMEEVVTSKNYFLDSFCFLTRGLSHYDTDKLDTVARINSHQRKFSRGADTINTVDINENIWRQWPSKKKNIFLDMMTKEDIYVYENHGYDLSYLF